MNNNDGNITININTDMMLMIKEDGENPKKNICLVDSAASRDAKHGDYIHTK